MNTSTIRSVVIVGQIIMYGTLVLSICKDDAGRHYIYVDNAPDGYEMVNDECLEITEKQFTSLADSIRCLLNKKVETEDERCSDCYVEISDDNGNEVTYTWPEKLHSDTFRSIGELVNGYVQNEVAADFLSMF